MNKVGMRVIYDDDGEIVAILGEMTGDVMARKQDVTLHYIDVEYGTVDFTTTDIISVNPSNKRLIVQAREIEETAEQKRIRELEDLLLTQANDTIGGLM